MGYVARRLDLSDNQKSQIKTIWEGERPNIAELVHELASEQKEMDVLTFHDGTPDDARVQDITARQGATLAKLLGEKEKITGRIYSQVLTPAQRPKADELLKGWSSHLDHIANRIGNGTTNK
ncbi:MAG TPA: Spy/CpxP family protein refolding chaperone [Terracidiphilus sp.]|jgi:Spy/CpxP family protein refolding chaperone